MKIIATLIGKLYILFIAITIFLLLALIGYFIDQKYPDIENKRKFDSEDLEKRLENAKGKTLNTVVSEMPQTPNDNVEILDVNANYNKNLSENSNKR